MQRIVDSYYILPTQGVVEVHNLGHREDVVAVNLEAEAKLGQHLVSLGHVGCKVSPEN